MKAHDKFAESLTVHHMGESSIASVQGGVCSFFVKGISWFLFIWQLMKVMNYHNYDNNVSNLFLDVKNEVDVSEEMKQVVFGF
jgi:hypothetical protein